MLYCLFCNQHDSTRSSYDDTPEKTTNIKKMCINEQKNRLSVHTPVYKFIKIIYLRIRIMISCT